ncbi:MAG: EfeM/EfeO family lipoprotein [Myxococcales bacterium]|nr:EfeM/EfeO family lipoprotein [Myxococcales bacterium]
MFSNRSLAPSAALVAMSFAIAGCASPQEVATQRTKDAIARELATLTSAARALRDATPAPDPDGWSHTADAQSIENMRAAWRRTRVAYERVEGAVAILFPETDVSIDERFDAFVTERADRNLFDGEGVTGMHAIERILWADSTPERVRTFEQGLPTMPEPGRTPRDATEATQFRDELVGRLVRDCEAMERQFRPLALDNATAFRGVIGSLEEQLEKIDKAATSEEESRYAQFTLADMRANLDGGVTTFEAFVPWLESVGERALVTQIRAKFTAIDAAYRAHAGDGIPAVPVGYNPEAPSAEHTATPYGQLRAMLVAESDPMRRDSLVSLMRRAATAMQIPELRR